MKPIIIALVMLAQAAAVAAQSTQLFRGRVIDERDRPLENARVLLGVRQIGRTNALGEFEVRVPKGTRSVRVEKSGFVPLTVETKGSKKDVPMVRGATLIVRVFDEAGEPVPMRPIRIAGPIGVASRITDERGEDRVTALPPGRYTADLDEFARPAASDVDDQRKQAQQLARARNRTMDRVDDGVELRPGEEAEIIVVDEWRPSSPRRPDSRSASLRGRVITPHGFGVPGAHVRLVAPVDVFSVAADATGTYSFDALPAGTFRLYAQAPGFVPVSFGQDRASGLTKDITLAAGQLLDGADVTLHRSGSISGRLVDERGEPYQLTSVQVIHWNAGDGQGVVAGGERTDALGRYRVAGLRPGSYYVTARPRAGGSEGPLYYPDKLRLADATAVTISEGRELSGVDMVLDSSRGARVYGVVTSSKSKPVSSGIVRLAGTDRTGSPIGARDGILAVDGSFEFLNVPPGEYAVAYDSLVPFTAITLTGLTLDPLRARIPAQESGGTAFVVGTTGPTDISIRTSLAPMVSGHVVLEGQDGPVAPSDFELGAARGSSRSAIRQDWTFELRDLSKTTRLALTAAPPGWWLKSLSVNGVNAANVPVEFTRPGRSAHGVTAVFSRTAARITGRVLNGAGAVVPMSPVLVFPADASRWGEEGLHLQSVRSDQSGRYEVSVPPGAYWIAASDQIGADPRELERLAPLAVRVDAAADGTVEQDLQVGGR